MTPYHNKYNNLLRRFVNSLEIVYLCKMNMKKVYYIFLLVAAMGVVACGDSDSFGGRNKYKRVVATVDDNELTLRDIINDMPEGLTGADSATFAKMYIDNWVLNNLKLARAEKILTSKDDIERLVDDYRKSLIMRQLDQYYVDNELNTEITEQQIKAHYRQHSNLFVLDHNMVRAIVVRAPKDFRNTSTLREAMGNVISDGIQEINALVEKHDLQITDLSTEWVSFSDFLSYLPTVRTRSYDNLLQRGKVQSMTSDDTSFYFVIVDAKRKGDIAPIECVEEDIRRMIYAERRHDIVKRYEEELKREAVSEERVEIDDEAMMDALNSRPNINDNEIVVSDAEDSVSEEDVTTKQSKSQPQEAKIEQSEKKNRAHSTTDNTEDKAEKKSEAEAETKNEVNNAAAESNVETEAKTETDTEAKAETKTEKTDNAEAETSKTDKPIATNN